MQLVPSALGRVVGRATLEASKNAPTLLFGTGVVGMIGSTVLACRATLKLDEVLQEHHRKTTQMRNATPGEGELAHLQKGDYTEEDKPKDIARVYGTTTLKIIKLYAPSVMLGAASIGCLTKSHGMLMRRNAALTAAYIAVDQAFGQYRNRVVDKYGEQQDLEFRYGSEEVEVIDERGKLTKEIRVSEDGESMYARFFDQTSGVWSKDPEYNYTWLVTQQQWFNNLLQLRGYVFLNEVYKALGLDESEAGQVVGWRLSNDGTANHVDFGMFDNDDQAKRDFVNGREGAVLLDFNVNGVILDKIDWRKDRDTRPWQS
jgi:hypothetical protein